MTREDFNAICRQLPGAQVSDPWGGGHDAWKVGDKMFAAIGAHTPGICVKTECVETAQMLIDAGVGSKAPYFHKSWLLLPWEADPGEAVHRIHSSYDLVRSKLTKKVQATLAPR